jgi:hypothetical protein
MHGPITFPRPQAPRRLILGAAFLLALAVSLPQRTTPASAQETKGLADTVWPAAPAKSAAGEQKRGIEINIGTDQGQDAGKAATGKDAGSTTEQTGADTDATHSITIKKGGKTVTMTGMPRDHEFDSVGQLARIQPALATMIVAIVALVFLAPVFAIALILGYRMRKARMLNETMLKLAEKGIVPPAEALEALAGNNPAAAGAMGGLPPSAAPIYEKATALRKRAAWSDLRKGVVMGAAGLGLCLFSLMDDGTPNSVGLVLLFVGVGYLVLWWFEERQFAPSNGKPGGDADPGSR